MKEFIALHNRTVSRDEIQTVIALAKEQNNTEVIYRLSKILNDHPDSNRFNINIINYPQETTQQVALAGTRHSGDYREALDECGRLKKGWHFVDGKVLKVQKRSGLLSQYTEKEFGHPFTKTLKAKFKELNWKYDRKNKRYYTPVPENEAEKEQQAQMFAFIEQEKATLEVNKPEKSPKTPTDKSAPSDSSSNKNIFLEEYRQLKAKYPEHLIIVSMEDQLNYSMYGKDAVIAADILNLQLLKGKRNDEFSNSVGFKYNYLREYLEKLVKAGYKVALVGKDLDKPKSPPKKNTPKTPSDKSAPSDLSSKKNTKKKAPRTTQYKGVKTIPLTDLYTDEKRFQNRKKLNEEIVENIVNNFKPTDLDPLVVWYDEKQGKTFVLAGHHRYEALKRLGHKTVPVKYANDDYPTEADAIRYAKEISNANRTLEEPYERAAIYRKYRDEGYSEKEINEKANIEGKNRSYILNLSCLNPKGSTMSTLVQFSQTQSKADKNEIERIADWIGQARRNAPELTNAHEQEMFDFLMNKEASKRTSTKAKFLEYVRACWNPFAPSEPLNLARMKYQSEGEKQYDEEVENLKTQISTYQGYIDNLKDRFVNPSNKDFVNPTAPDYMTVKKIADDKIAEYNTKIQYYQSQLMKVYQNKQTYIKPTGQTALFGKYPETDTDRFKKMKVSELRTFTMKYYNLYLKGDSATIEKYVKEVVFINTAGRKIAYGEAMYSAKAAVIAHLKTLIKNSTYNNWGDRKASDGKDVLGYLNFKSKITIDNKKRHVRISLVVYKDRRTELKNVEVGKNKKVPHFAQDPVGTLQDGRNETLSTESVAKTVPNSTLSAPEVFVEHSPDPATQSITPRNNSLANKMATLQNRTFETFIIADPQMQAFLGDVERKNTGSTAITITGGAGSGKTRFAFQFINALAQNYKVGHASLEEQPDSKLYFDKVQQYLDQTAQANVEAPEIENMHDLQALIERNDVIVIDSFTKIREWDRNFLLDRDLRKKYNGKLFLIIFQQTVAGNMRGGTTSEFDGDIILYTQVFPDYRENYIYPSKNRYNSTPSEQLRYSVYHQQLLPSESTPSDSSPVTSNTYEVIY
ncbi:ParB N-terminal domain-containing protein [Capnocytophaga sputigena]|uniref:LPD3 domain-containing protein n=1 Tax=Capnocytophaga sputigena TaxID=1019 RepID=UPI0028D7AA55|nr:ParB N-terminal domain-containing protein [Capnocytophaga sputigena]